MGVFRVRLSGSAQSGAARQVLQSLQVVGQTQVIGDMLHGVESGVNNFRGLILDSRVVDCEDGVH